MIKYQDGELADLLPSFFKDKPEVMAISYACRMAMARLLDISKVSRMYADIDSMPEYILDYMATELNAQYYSEAFDIAIKRDIIKSAIVWKMKAGTKEAVQELISVLFGDGKVTPWNEFTEGAGTPGTFDITTSAIMVKDSIEQFSDLIEKTKNISSHLRFVSTEHELESMRVVAANVAQGIESQITNDIKIDNPDQAYIYEEYIGIYDFAEGKDFTVISAEPEEPTQAERRLYYACHLAADTEQIFIEVRDNETDLQGQQLLAAALVQESITII